MLIKKSLSTKLPTEERRTVGKMNGTAITNRLQSSFKIKDKKIYVLQTGCRSHIMNNNVDI